MGICPHCGNEVREDVWVCGLCGEPIASRNVGQTPEQAAPDDAYEEYQPPPATPSFTPANTSSRRLWLVIGSGVVAILAIVLVSLFVVRDPARGPFVGTWRVPDDDTKIRIDQGAGYTLTLIDRDGKETGPFTATLTGTRLETKLESQSDDPAQAGWQELARSMLLSVLGDFTMVFTPADNNRRLTLTIEGSSLPAGTGATSMELERD